MRDPKTILYVIGVGRDSELASYSTAELAAALSAALVDRDDWWSEVGKLRRKLQDAEDEHAASTKCAATLLPMLHERVKEELEP